MWGCRDVAAELISSGACCRAVSSSPSPTCPKSLLRVALTRRLTLFSPRSLPKCDFASQKFAWVGLNWRPYYDTLSLVYIIFFANVVHHIPSLENCFKEINKSSVSCSVKTDVGSSIINTFGFLIKHLIISTFCF